MITQVMNSIRVFLPLAVMLGAVVLPAQTPVDQPRFEVSSASAEHRRREPAMRIPPRGAVVTRTFLWKTSSSMPTGSRRSGS
jgi:hypothetical protein